MDNLLAENAMLQGKNGCTVIRNKEGTMSAVQRLNHKMQLYISYSDLSATGGFFGRYRHPAEWECRRHSTYLGCRGVLS